VGPKGLGDLHGGSGAASLPVTRDKGADLEGGHREDSVGRATPVLPIGTTDARRRTTSRKTNGVDVARAGTDPDPGKRETRTLGTPTN